jgi:hypothetical protein
MRIILHVIIRLRGGIWITGIRHSRPGRIVYEGDTLYGRVCVASSLICIVAYATLEDVDVLFAVLAMSLSIMFAAGSLQCASRSTTILTCASKELMCTSTIDLLVCMYVGHTALKKGKPPHICIWPFACTALPA